MNKADVHWADIIIAMESKHRDRLQSSFPRALANKTVNVLDIPDEYRFMDDELVEILKQMVPPLLNTEPPE